MSIMRAAVAGVVFSLIIGGAGALEGSPEQTEGSAAAQAARQQVQPLNNAPVWRDVRSGVPASTASMGREAGVLIQASGERWRQLRNSIVKPGGAAVLGVAAAMIGLFFLWKGPQRGHEPPTGRLMFRFHFHERFIHWSIATLFVLLGLSGLILLFGRHVLLPILGADLFGWVGFVCKVIHNVCGPLFAVAMVLGVITFARDCLPRAYDLQWLRVAGGYLNGQHVPAGKFNAGQKLWFWGGLLGLGVLVSASGFVLDFPNFGQPREAMQLAHLVHVVIALLFIGASFFHIYLGTIGQQGAYAAMATGYVDEAWAKDHHEIWYNEVKAGKVRQVDPGPGLTPPRTARQ